MEYVYIVLFDWSTDDNSDVEAFVYKNYIDAVTKFKTIISDEMNTDLSWVKNAAFNSAGQLNKGFILNEFTDDTRDSDLYWHLVNYDNYNQHIFLNIQKKEIL